MKTKIEKGCFGESIPWEMETDHLVFDRWGLPCDHCTEILPGHPRYDARTKGRQSLCPVAVVSFNEGGYGSTAVCLQCILDAAKQLGLPSA